MSVYTKCFSFELVEGYEEDINKFTECWEKLNLPKTPKYHIVKHHVREFCASTGRGLGWHNEQAAESVHSDFAVIDYNSGHL